MSTNDPLAKVERAQRRRTVPVVAGALAFDAFVTVSDTTSGPHNFYGSALALSPIVASTLLDPLATALLGVVSLVVGLLFGVVDHDFSSSTQVVRVLVIGAFGVIATLISHGRAKRDRRLAQLEVVAEAAQRAIIPEFSEAVRHLQVAARYVSATAEARLGGDFYDVIETEFGVRAVIGDGKGHGLQVIQLAARALNAFRRNAGIDPNLTILAQRLDAIVAEMSDGDEFVTAVLAEFDPSGFVRLANCGHPEPWLLASDRSALLTPSRRSLPLGLGARPHIDAFKLDIGDRVLLYTDGALEARSPDGTFFDLADAGDLLRTGDLNIDLDAVMTRLAEHTSAQWQDDIALVLVEHGRLETFAG